MVEVTIYCPNSKFRQLSPKLTEKQISKFSGLSNYDWFSNHLSCILFLSFKFSASTILHVWFRSKVSIREISIAFGRIFLEIFLCLVTMALFSETWITVVNLFWPFTLLPCKFYSPQVKWNLISSIINFIYELCYELPTK